MLSPTLDDARADLASAANLFRRLSAFARAFESATLAELSPQPQWLVDVRATLAVGTHAAADWYALAPEVVSTIGTAYSDYQALFASAVQQASGTLSASDWTSIVGALQSDAASHASDLAVAQARMDSVYADLQSVHDSIVATMTKTWQAHDAAYSALAATSYSIGQLYARLDALSDNVDANDLSAGKTIFQTVATVSIPVMRGLAEGLPFCSIALSVFSLSQNIYTMVVTDRKINDNLSQLGNLLNQRDQDTQAIGATNAVLSLLQSLRESYEDASQHLPRLSAIWKEQAGLLSVVADALAAGAAPAQMPELSALALALPTWNDLATLGSAIVNSPIQTTTPATLAPPAAANATA